MNRLGILYEKGDGVKLDLTKATQLYRMASERGHPQAQLNMGLRSYHLGDLESALRYAKLAAEQGLVEGEYDVGYLYAQKGDHYEAKRWLARAAAKGHEPSKATLAQYAAADCV